MVSCPKSGSVVTFCTTHLLTYLPMKAAESRTSHTSVVQSCAPPPNGCCCSCSVSYVPSATTFGSACGSRLELGLGLAFGFGFGLGLGL